MFDFGEAEDPRKLKTFHEYQRIDLPEGSRQHLVAMGPAYVSKTSLWEVSRRNPKVAAMNEQSDHHFTFKSIVIEASKRKIAPKEAKGPEDVYIDYWLSKQWTEAVVGRISEAGKMEIAREAIASVERYIDAGRSLPEPFSAADLDLRARKLREAEEARTDALKALKDAMTAKAAALEAKASAEKAAQAAADRFVREAMEPPTLAEVAEKMDFKPEDGKEGLWRLPEGYAFADQIIISGRTFVRSQPARGMPSREEGEGAVALLATEDTLETKKRTKIQLLRQLMQWFPSKAIALLNEALGHRGGEVLRDFLQLDVVSKKAPAKKAGKEKDDPP